LFTESSEALISAPWRVETTNFDGPLDLLLYLVKRDGISLRKLPVAEITNAYLAYLDALQAIDLEVAGEYLVMAATLAHLKSLELLPRPPTPIDEEEEDPKARLVRQLVEYRQYKAASAALLARDIGNRDWFIREGVRVRTDDLPLYAPVDAWGLLSIFQELLKRQRTPEPVVSFEGGSGPTLIETASWVLAELGGPKGKKDLHGLFRALKTRAHRLVLFLSVLEMARLGWIGLMQSGHLGAVQLVSKVAHDLDVSALASVEEVTA
jgi:segregation and condensation protein A